MRSESTALPRLLSSEERLSLSNEFGEIAASGNPSDFIPVLRYLPNTALDLFKDLNRRFYVFVQKIVKEHYKTFEKV